VTQYFDEQPAVASRPGRVRLRVPGVDAELSVDRGVFSAGGIDPGTVELLRTDSDAQLAGDVLDLGCGYGPIAAALALRHPEAVVWAVDVNARARQLAAANAAELGLGGRVHVAAPDEVPPEVCFSAIWSNPPIRIGKAALHDLLSTWLPRLTEDGKARMVVHKHLGSDSLAVWLTGEGWAVRRLGSRKGYRILEVTRSL
jgi:16S rRNA G1207 methylase RsmC